ncbi:hypothetical protein GBAR_LOCUS12330 [Geodia barretti]|uniref:Uncharacterized protein n=1 Tax=Geodia barretti TaxID=519541 RepID=A0AA35S2C1_GEOBA|nr:hypothetical protein GBAR_LOCUS12330 [Geodia barretti]
MIVPDASSSVILRSPLQACLPKLVVVADLPAETVMIKEQLLSR